MVYLTLVTGLLVEGDAGKAADEARYGDNRITLTNNHVLVYECQVKSWRNGAITSGLS